jgi:hypothetical protein
MDIPKDKSYPPEAVQCDGCGGYGCIVCEDKGWLPYRARCGRVCENEECRKPIPPSQVAVYCSNLCASSDI